jgi:LuxR family maltose regulon positive regulatory protein
LSALLHRFAAPLILTGDHAALPRALASLDTHATASDPWLALTGALTRLEAGDLSAARADLRHVRQCWPSHDTAELAVLQAAVEQLAAPTEKPSATGAATDLSVATDLDALSAEPSLEAISGPRPNHSTASRPQRSGPGPGRTATTSPTAAASPRP